MEHKLIQGGEQYLPFARSRIKALKATGLKYASQKFEIDGVSVKVRIAGEHEYIELEGSPVKILSGVVKAGEIVVVPETEDKAEHKVLRSFRPTQNCWEFPLKKDPAKSAASFNDEKLLSKQKPSWTHPGQYTSISPSMFSGLMSKAVAVIMGRGLEVKYSYAWDKCHGVVMDASGKPWLVEISLENGVIAKKLPVDKPNKGGSVDAERVASELFGGVPSGGSFPSGGALTSALASGSVIRLASVEDMAEYFLCVPQASHIGWSFGPNGSVAYNAVVRIGEVEPGAYVGKLFRLDFILSESQKVATLSLVEQGGLTKTTYDDDGNALGAPFFFQMPGGSTSNVVARTVPAGTTGADSGGPLFVCHIDGEVEIIRSTWFDAGGGNSQIFTLGNLHQSAYAGSPYIQATPRVEIRTVYACRAAQGQKTNAYSLVLRDSYDYSIVAEFGVEDYIDPDSGTPLISTTYKFTRFRDSDYSTEAIVNNYADRDSLFLVETAPTSSFTRVYKSYITASSFSSDAEISTSGEFTSGTFPDAPDAIGTIGVVTGYTKPIGGGTELTTFTDYVYQTDEHIPERRKIYWSDGNINVVHDPDPYVSSEVPSAGIIPRYMTSPSLKNIPESNEYVYAGFKSLIFSESLNTETPLPRVRYNFIGCN